MMNEKNSKPDHDRIVRLDELTALTGLSPSSIWRYESKGEFPRRLKLGLRAVGWRASQIEAWIESREATAPDSPADQGDAPSA